MLLAPIPRPKLERNPRDGKSYTRALHKEIPLYFEEFLEAVVVYCAMGPSDIYRCTWLQFGVRYH